MGKTPKPLTIVAIGDVALWEELQKLESQGHTIVRQEKTGNSIDDPIQLSRGIRDADIILGPNCWRMDPAHRDYLTLAIKEARLQRYGTHEEKQSKKKRKAVAHEFDASPVDEPVLEESGE